MSITSTRNEKKKLNYLTIILDKYKNGRDVNITETSWQLKIDELKIKLRGCYWTAGSPRRLQLFIYSLWTLLIVQHSKHRIKFLKNSWHSAGSLDKFEKIIIFGNLYFWMPFFFIQMCCTSFNHYRSKRVGDSTIRRHRVKRVKYRSDDAIVRTTEIIDSSWQTLTKSTYKK